MRSAETKPLLLKVSVIRVSAESIGVTSCVRVGAHADSNGFFRDATSQRKIEVARATQ